MQEPFRDVELHPSWMARLPNFEMHQICIKPTSSAFPERYAEASFCPRKRTPLFLAQGSDGERFIEHGIISEELGKQLCFRLIHSTMLSTPLIFRCAVTQMRIIYMHRFGGMYADLDIEALRDMSPLLLGSTEPVLAYLSATWGLRHNIPNAWMASPPGHPFWQARTPCPVPSTCRTPHNNRMLPFCITCEPADVQ